jgi:phosphonate transport system substrate-binding protein
MILDGTADCAAIDSTVLERQRQLTPEIGTRLRSVAALGPTPMPPLVVSSLLGNHAVESCREALLTAHKDAALRDVLAKAGIRRLAAVCLAHYEPLQQMHAAAINTGRAVIA